MEGPFKDFYSIQQIAVNFHLPTAFWHHVNHEDPGQWQSRLLKEILTILSFILTLVATSSSPSGLTYTRKKKLKMVFDGNTLIT